MKRQSTQQRDVDEEGAAPVSLWKVLMAFGIIAVLLLGYFVYSNYRLQAKRTENQYNGFDFAQAEGGLWVTRIEIGHQPYNIPFYYHPRDVEDVIVDPNAVKPVYGAPRELYISIDPDAGAQPVIAGAEISRITGSKYNIFNIETHGALSEPTDLNADLPVINCKNSSEDRVVIQFVPGKQNVIVRSDVYPSCVIINYVNASESIRVADRYVYMLLKVMK